MTTRTTESTVTFLQEFNLLSLHEGAQPAGTYRLVIVDEEIPGLSFIAYRRASTVLHLPAISALSTTRQVFEVDREELESALRADDLSQHAAS